MAAKRLRQGKVRVSGNTESKIIDVATKLFARYGYDGVSTKSICEQARANISALHYYFKTKRNLYCEIFERFGRQIYNDAALRILQPPDTVEEMKIRLEMCLLEVVQSIKENPYIMNLVQWETYFGGRRKMGIFKYFLPLLTSLIEFFSLAKKRGLVKSSLSAEMMAIFFLKQMQIEPNKNQHVMKLCGVNLNKQANLKKYVCDTIKIFVDGVAAK